MHTANKKGTSPLKTKGSREQVLSKQRVQGIKRIKTVQVLSKRFQSTDYKHGSSILTFKAKRKQKKKNNGSIYTIRNIN